jgi:hypothetical protein
MRNGQSNFVLKRPRTNNAGATNRCRAWTLLEQQQKDAVAAVDSIETNFVQLPIQSLKHIEKQEAAMSGRSQISNLFQAVLSRSR